jgi:hypothetical protein
MSKGMRATADVKPTLARDPRRQDDLSAQCMSEIMRRPDGLQWLALCPAVVVTAQPSESSGDCPTDIDTSVM